MFGFIKNIFVVTVSFFSCNALKCVSMNNQGCTVRPKIIKLKVMNLHFNLIALKISKCGGSCNNIDNSYAKLCIRDISKNMNVKVLNLSSRT